jgi:large subunit ribosomal protein L22
MKVKAQAKYVRESPYKVRRVLDLVRGLPVGEAETVLKFVNRGAAEPVVKVFADEGPTLKRFRPAARGRATRIRKRTSHITIVVANKEVN